MKVLNHQKIYRVLADIPKGRVATYGQIAKMLGFPRHARQVGYALAALADEQTLPWHRVVNAQGEISTRSQPGYAELQKLLLEDEGVVFDEHNRISLAVYQWQPDSEQ